MNPSDKERMLHIGHPGSSDTWCGERKDGEPDWQFASLRKAIPHIYNSSRYYPCEDCLHEVAKNAIKPSDANIP